MYVFKTVFKHTEICNILIFQNEIHTMNNSRMTKISWFPYPLKKFLCRVVSENKRPLYANFSTVR